MNITSWTQDECDDLLATVIQNSQVYYILNNIDGLRFYQMMTILSQLYGLIMLAAQPGRAFLPLAELILGLLQVFLPLQTQTAQAVILKHLTAFPVRLLLDSIRIIWLRTAISIHLQIGTAQQSEVRHRQFL